MKNLPPTTLYTWVADYSDAAGELRTARFQARTREEALHAAKEYCAPLTLRTFHSLCEQWESAVLPAKYPGQPLADRIVLGEAA